MTVGELIEELDAFGTGVQVKLVIVRGDREYVITDFDVAGQTPPGEVFAVEIGAELP
jgi:hypothetical protein